MENLVKQVEEIINARKEGEILEILPQLRKMIRGSQEAIQGHIDALYDSGFYYQAFHGEVPGIQMIGWDVAKDGSKIPSIGECDRVLIQIDITKDPGYLVNLISIFSNFDCTDCCNAVQWVKASEHCILMEVDTSRTYHS